MENIPIGFELPLESAHDDDLGENSRISYELKTSNQGLFELITKSNGGLSLKVMKQIDWEEEDFFQYDLIAYDHGQPSRDGAGSVWDRTEPNQPKPVQFLGERS